MCCVVLARSCDGQCWVVLGLDGWVVMGGDALLLMMWSRTERIARCYHHAAIVLSAKCNKSSAAIDDGAR
mgnify:CR=1 FL=1